MTPSHITVDSPVGRLVLIGDDRVVCGIRFLGSAADETSPTVVDIGPEREAEATVMLAGQLSEYFGGARRTFDVPLAPRGTEFQRAVWSALQRIPFGVTSTYGTVAGAAGSPRAARAVGSANHRNPIPIVIPCHRVIGSTGQPRGYAGGPTRQAFLLGLERQAVESGR